MIFLIEKLNEEKFNNGEVLYEPYKYTYTQDKADDFCRGCYKYKKLDSSSMWMPIAYSQFTNIVNPVQVIEKEYPEYRCTTIVSKLE